MKKYELLLISKTVQKKREVNEIILFLNELLNDTECEDFFITYELTLLVYNIVLNSFNDISFFLNKQLFLTVKQMVVQILQQIYKGKLNEIHLAKINNDISFIQTHKQYVYIYDVVLFGYYFFF